MATSSSGPVRGRIDALVDAHQAVHSENVDRFCAARQRFLSLGREDDAPQREAWTRDYDEARARMEHSYDVLRMVRILQANLDSNPTDAE
jgi:hypothetical protein